MQQHLSDLRHKGGHTCGDVFMSDRNIGQAGSEIGNNAQSCVLHSRFTRKGGFRKPRHSDHIRAPACEKPHFRGRLKTRAVTATGTFPLTARPCPLPAMPELWCRAGGGCTERKSQHAPRLRLLRSNSGGRARVKSMKSSIRTRLPGGRSRRREPTAFVAYTKPTPSCARAAILAR